MSLSILKQTGSSLESASPNKEQLYYPSPYAMGQVQALAKQGGGCTDGEAAAAQTLKRTRREHIYEVPYPRWTEEEHYSHMRDGTPAPVSNIYQTPRKADDSDSEGAAYTFRLTTNGSYGDHQEMSEAECDRDQHTRAKHLEALGIHVTPGYGIT
ncbi:hypothetical protein HPB50_018633 [Hyalomma asiaticum]|uniref:Uncharacterized protein n=1 Tax=Hyalomma asiaticum TaxID=266040 RepID=A0ACB7SRT8_HYAAI|nr:hypothetical protein HPB50_018633 [Hyalomma asiaticum]